MASMGIADATINRASNLASEPPTVLEQMRRDLHLPAQAHAPEFRVERASSECVWFFDGDRAVAFVHEKQAFCELRCHGPNSECPPADLPKYYHIPTYVGARISIRWWLRQISATATDTSITYDVLDKQIRFELSQRWSDGSRSNHVGHLRYDEAWGAYVLDMKAKLEARRVLCPQEFCNVLPAKISDSRPEHQRFQYTFWQHPDGPKRLGKNPLWWNSVGGQDAAGERRIVNGGFLGFGVHDQFNPVVEIVRASPEAGAGTCDNLQDEHIQLLAPTGEHVGPTGWFHLEADYRLFSIPPALATTISQQARDLKCGAHLAWKFQYPAIPELPRDLTRVELPGSPHIGEADWSQPVSWDEPFAGVLWTPSSDPAAAIYWDRTVGRSKPGSIRLRPEGQVLSFNPGSGHTLHTNEGRRYRFSMWLKTSGDVKGWIEAAEVLFNYGSARWKHASNLATADSDWTYVSCEYQAKGEEAPFAMLYLFSEGKGSVWFTDMSFVELAD